MASNYRIFLTFCIKRSAVQSSVNEIDINVTLFFFYDDGGDRKAEANHLESFLNNLHEHNGAKCFATKKFAIHIGQFDNSFFRYFQENCYDLENDPDYRRIKEGIKLFVEELKFTEDLNNEQNGKIYHFSIDNVTIKFIIDFSIKNSLNYFDSNGRNVLHNACLNYRPPDIIRIFVHHCSEEDMNTPCKNLNYRPLRYLLDNFSINENIVNLFFEKGAESEYLTYANSEHKIQIAEYNEFAHQRLSLFQLLGIGSYKDVTIGTLLNMTKLKHLINIQSFDKSTILHHAVRAKNRELVRILLENGADPNVKDEDGLEDGFTPLHVAVYNNFEDYVKYF